MRYLLDTHIFLWAAGQSYKLRANIKAIIEDEANRIRMLIWQAISRNITLISGDAEFKRFEKHGLKLLWK